MSPDSQAGNCNALLRVQAGGEEDSEGATNAQSSSSEESDGEEGEKFGRLIDAAQAPEVTQ